MIAVLATLMVLQVRDWIARHEQEAGYREVSLLNVQRKPDGKIYFSKPDKADFIEASAAGAPAVVQIASFNRLGWGTEKGRISEGSGVLISADGYIVTNNHVLKGSEDIMIKTLDNRQYKAAVIGIDRSTDIAVLKIDRRDGPHLKLGNSDEIRVGEWVIAIGNPYHLSSTVTAGIISATGRTINLIKEKNSIESFIQTDAVVNEGNSGGALVNSKGEMIGLNTAIFTKSGNFEGYSFAIPSNMVRKVVNDLLKFGKVQRGVLGINIENPDPSKLPAEELNVPLGAYVSGVNTRSAAQLAGLRKGDIITHINSIRIRNYPQLQEQVGLYQPGDKVEVTFFREGKEYVRQATLKGRDTDFSVIIRSDKDLRELGLELRDLGPSEQQAHGVLVHSVYKNSQAAISGIEPGFLINRVDGKVLKNVDQVIAYLKNTTEVKFAGKYDGQPKTHEYLLYKDSAGF